MRSRKVALITQPSILPLARGSFSPHNYVYSSPFHTSIASSFVSIQSAAHFQPLRRLHSHCTAGQVPPGGLLHAGGQARLGVSRGSGQPGRAPAGAPSALSRLSPPLCLYLHKLDQPLRSQQAVHQSADGNSGCRQLPTHCIILWTSRSIAVSSKREPGTSAVQQGG